MVVVEQVQPQHLSGGKSPGRNTNRSQLNSNLVDYRCADLVGISKFIRNPQNLVLPEPNVYGKQKFVFYDGGF